ncbi:unnamed protein product [Dimorphilus gyrociliatus]|uniref:SH3 domain-containing protein n=1 Tax=Dimorphilus gyrociliatus TaxID=2664684 RepID=A0A7I8W5P8_9ANNE|nr:unnamed protein product [Dimorphilus gyrociliatus]
MEGQYVVAIYDFTEVEPGEMEIYMGDVLLITKQIDNNWLKGKIRGKSGNFPRSFVQMLNIPTNLPNGQKLFACCTDYHAQTPDDLTIIRGDVIVGKSAIDANWWRGEKQFATGAFPLSHVYELDSKDLGPDDKKQSSNSIGKVRAITNLSAQLDTELPLRNGEIIDVIEQIDESFLYGRNDQGQEGQFLINCVEILEGNIKLEDEKEKETKTKWWESEDNVETNPIVIRKEDEIPFEGSLVNNVKITKECESTTNSPRVSKIEKQLQSNYAQSIYPFIASQEDELSFNAGDILYLNRYINEDWIEGQLGGSVGIFPASFIKFIDPPEKDKTNVQENLKVLYPYTATLSNELSVKEDEIVKVLEHFNNDWYVVENYLGETGLCPVSYLGSLTEERKLDECTRSGSNNNHELAIKREERESFLKESVSVSTENITYRTRPKPEIKPKPTIKKSNARLSASLEDIIAKEMEAAAVNDSTPKPPLLPPRKSPPNRSGENKPSKSVPTRPAPPRPNIPERRIEPKRPPPIRRSPVSVQSDVNQGMYLLKKIYIQYKKIKTPLYRNIEKT